MTMTPSQAIAYLHGTAPANPDDHHLTKRYEACAALAPLLGRTDLDQSEFIRVGTVFHEDNEGRPCVWEDDDAEVSEGEALYVQRDQTQHPT